MALSPYYYGVQRKAITGMSYGPYYGKRYMGGRGQADTQVGTQAGITELSERYATEPAISTSAPTPAISGMYGSQGEMTGKQTGLPGTMAEANPQEARNTLAWGFGLRSTPPSGFPQPTGGYKTVGQIGKVAAGVLTSNPLTGMIYNYGKLLVDSLLSPVFPGLYSPESLTTTAEALRGAKQSAEYSSWGMFGKGASDAAAEAARGAAKSAELSSMGYFGGTAGVGDTSLGGIHGTAPGSSLSLGAYSDPTGVGMMGSSLPGSIGEYGGEGIGFGGGGFGGGGFDGGDGDGGDGGDGW